MDRTKAVSSSARLAAGLVFGLTALCASRAYAVQSLSTPNAAIFGLNVAGGAGSVSASFRLPVANQSVLIDIASNSVGHRGTAFIDITYHSVAPAIITWAGIHAEDSAGPDTTPGVSSGYRPVPAGGVWTSCPRPTPAQRFSN